MYNEKIVNVITGEVTIRNFTEAEIAEVEALKKEAAERTAIAEKVEAAKEAATAKLEALGLTAEDLKALGL